MSLASMIVSEPPLRVGAGAWYPWSQGLANRYVVRGRYEHEVDAYYRSGNYLVLPRAVCPLPLDPAHDNRVEGIAVNFTSSFEARNQDQTDLIEASVALLKAGRSHVVQAGTGFGKTPVGCEIIARVGRKALIIASKEDILYDRWWPELNTVLGLEPHEVGTIQGDRVKVAGCKVVLGMVQSIAKPERYPPEVFADFGLVVFDECHRLGSKEFSKACWVLPAKLRLGLSATPTRSDGCEAVFLAHLGPVAVVADQTPMRAKVLRYKTKWKQPRRFDALTGKWLKLPHEAGRNDAVFRALYKNTERNEFIASLVAVAAKKDRIVVVFSDVIEHLDLMHAAFVKHGIPAGDVGYYVGGMTVKEREASLKRRVVLATYQYGAEGTNAPDLDCCLMASPRAKVEQVVGRILRAKEGKKEPVVFDLVDADSAIYSNYALSRARAYAAKGMKVIDMG
jgi:superfamily II DNA or RNA helicase